MANDLLNFVAMLFIWGLAILLFSAGVDVIPGFERIHGLIVGCTILVCLFIRVNCSGKKH